MRKRLICMVAAFSMLLLSSCGSGSQHVDTPDDNLLGSMDAAADGVKDFLTRDISSFFEEDGKPDLPKDSESKSKAGGRNNEAETVIKEVIEVKEIKETEAREMTSYEMEFGDGTYELKLPSDWLVHNDKELGSVNCRISDYNNEITVEYTDSYIKVGDKEELDEFREYFHEVNNYEGSSIKVSSLNTSAGKVYVFSCITPGLWNSVDILQPIEGYDTYMWISIYDDTVTHDAETGKSFSKYDIGEVADKCLVR